MLRKSYLVLGTILFLASSCLTTEKFVDKKFKSQEEFIKGQNDSLVSDIDSVLGVKYLLPGKKNHGYTLEQISTWGIGNFPNNIKVTRIKSSSDKQISQNGGKLTSLKQNRVIKLIVISDKPEEPITYTGVSIIDDVYDIASPANISQDKRQYLRTFDQVIPNSDYAYINSLIYTNGDIDSKFTIVLFTERE